MLGLFQACNFVLIVCTMGYNLGSMNSDDKLISGFFVFAISLVVGVVVVLHFNGTPWQKLEEAERARRELERHPETAPIRGFTDVRNTPDGNTVVFDAHIDNKGPCWAFERQTEGICTLLVYMGDGNSMLVRVRTCSPTVTVNCLRCEDAEGQPLHKDVRAIDSSGDEIDFLGDVLIEPPNTWMWRPTPPLRFTGVVTQLNGSGRILQPITKIEPVS
jgi:hypothetical protein